MHATDLIETNLRTACQSIHRSRTKALLTGVDSALNGKCVSVTGLGRRSRRRVTERAAIKQSDRLVGNASLAAESTLFYRELAAWILAHNPRPRVLIDWSPVSQDGKFHVLRASVPAGGRGLTLYQEVHPESTLGKSAVHKQFLAQLARIIPAHCRPVLVTDAGFKNPWFRAVEAMGWAWIGRIRGAVMVTRVDESQWLRATQLGRLLNTGAPTDFGEFVLAESSPIQCRICGLRKPPKGRMQKNKRGGRSRSGISRKNAARENEPWVIATSLSADEASPQAVVDAYTTRMQIEEAFRDTKDEYYGLGLNRSRSRSAQRFTVLLLINALALFAVWLIGKAAEYRDLHWSYQANTVRLCRVLSHVFLGLRVVSRAPFAPTAEEIRRAQCDVTRQAQFVHGG